MKYMTQQNKKTWKITNVHPTDEIFRGIILESAKVNPCFILGLGVPTWDTQTPAFQGISEYLVIRYKSNVNDVLRHKSYVNDVLRF